MLGVLRFPSPQLRQQTRLPKFPTVARMLTLMTMLRNHIEDEDETDGVEKAKDCLPQRLKDDDNDKDKDKPI